MPSSTTRTELPFVLGTWSGLTTYQCNHCQWDTTVEAEAWKHYQAQHAPPESPILVADASGKEVKRVTRKPRRKETDNEAKNAE